MEFIHLLPPNTNTLTILAHNLQHFNKFHWETKATLLTFTRIASIFTVPSLTLVSLGTPSMSIIGASSIVPCFTDHVSHVSSLGSRRRPHFHHTIGLLPRSMPNWFFSKLVALTSPRTTNSCVDTRCASPASKLVLFNRSTALGIAPTRS